MQTNRNERMGRNTRKRKFQLKSLNAGFSRNKDGADNPLTEKRRKRRRRRKLRLGRKKESRPRSIRGKFPKISRKRLAEGRLRKLWLEGESYRNWKRKKSTELLLQQPESQVAIAQLWQQLIKQVNTKQL